MNKKVAIPRREEAEQEQEGSYTGEEVRTGQEGCYTA